MRASPASSARGRTRATTTAHASCATPRRWAGFSATKGAGAYIGRRLVGNLLKGLYDEELRRLFFEEERITYDEIIRRVYREGMGNRFLASFTRFAARHIDRPEIEELICDAFRTFVRRNLARYPADAEVSALGGVAFRFERQLRRVLEAEGRRVGCIAESPDEGLSNYHIWKK